MAEEKAKTVSVIISTNCGNELARHYLPQLCAHIEECGTITDYEVVVSDTSIDENTETYQYPDLKKVRVIGAKATLTEVENLNKALFASTMNYVLILGNHILPTHSYFSEIFQLFHYTPSLFGVSSNTLSTTTDDRISGPKTLDPNKSGICIKELAPQMRKTTYTLALSSTNMLVDRHQLCLMGGFQTFFNNVESSKNEACIRAWRSGRKCFFTANTHCKKMATEEPANNENKILPRKNSLIYDDIIINYLHTNRLKHFVFWLKLLLGYSNSLVVRDASNNAYRNACKQFFSKLVALYNVRKWSKLQRCEPFDKIAKGFFSNEQLQEVSQTKENNDK